VLIPREYRRLAVAASHLGPVGPVFGEFLGLGEQETLREATYGLSGPMQIEQAAWRAALVDALGRAHLPFVLIAGGAPLDVMAKRRLLIVPTLDFLDVELGNRLRAYAAAGGKLVTGPRTPTRDLRLEPSAEFGELPGARLTPEMLTDRHLLQESLTAWAAAAGVERVAPAKDPNVDTALHVRPDGTPALLFVGTSSAQPLTAAVELDKEAELEDVLGGERLRGQTLAVPLEPFQVRLLRFM
jgi:beta-galactosidase